jgi:quercetin 2,3-dioxygenase
MLRRSAVFGRTVSGTAAAGWPHHHATRTESGKVLVNGERETDEGDLAIFALAGNGIIVQASADTKLLVMGGELIAESVVGHGPFVMNCRAEIQQAFED